MKLCLLYLSVLTLLQLESRFAAAETLWLPTLDSLGSIIHICEYELFQRGKELDLMLLSRRTANVNVNVGDQSIKNANIVYFKEEKRNPTTLDLLRDLFKERIQIARSAGSTKKQKYMKIAECVHHRLTLAYDEELLLDD